MEKMAKTLRNLSNLLEKYLQEKTPVLPTENSFSLFCENFDYLFDHALPAKNDITIHLSYCQQTQSEYYCLQMIGNILLRIL